MVRSSKLSSRSPRVAASPGPMRDLTTTRTPLLIAVLSASAVPNLSGQEVNAPDSFPRLAPGCEAERNDPRPDWCPEPEVPNPTCPKWGMRRGADGRCRCAEGMVLDVCGSCDTPEHAESDPGSCPLPAFRPWPPGDPEEYADSVELGTTIAIEAFLQVGCPSEHPWSGAILAALEKRAETSLLVRRKWVETIGYSRAVSDTIATASGIILFDTGEAEYPHLRDCPEVDRKRAEDWVVRWVTDSYESGRWAAGDPDPDVPVPVETLGIPAEVATGTSLLGGLGRFPGLLPDVETFLVEVACDEEIHGRIRRKADEILPAEKQIPYLRHRPVINGHMPVVVFRDGDRVGISQSEWRAMESRKHCQERKAALLSAEDPTPAGFAMLVATGDAEAATLFDWGCPSRNAWADSALAAIEERAKTDVRVRTSLADAITARIRRCPQADQDHTESWVAGWVDTGYETRAWLVPHPLRYALMVPESFRQRLHIRLFGADENAGVALARALGAFRSIRAQALARRIACDPRVAEAIRGHANLSLTANQLSWGAQPNPDGGLVPVLRLDREDGNPPKCEGVWE